MVIYRADRIAAFLQSRERIHRSGGQLNSFSSKPFFTITILLMSAQNSSFHLYNQVTIAANVRMAAYLYRFSVDPNVRQTSEALHRKPDGPYQKFEKSMKHKPDNQSYNRGLSLIVTVIFMSISVLFIIGLTQWAVLTPNWCAIMNREAGRSSSRNRH